MTTFADLGVPSHLSDALARQGITTPTPVQAAAVPGALAGRDVAAQAPTGSGKTLAFGLPVLARTGHGTARRPATLVLVPTRELATQIVDALRPLAEADGIRLAAIFGGVGIQPQRQALRRGVDVVVGCPGRLEDLIAQGDLKLDQVRLAVVDEADRMADVGFLPAVRRLLGATPSDRQTLLFSATLGGPVGKLVADHQRDPERHDVAATPGQRNRARHLAMVVAQDERTRWTAEALRAAGTGIVFCRTRHRADRVARQLDRLGVATAAIHGGRTQAQRTKALNALHSGRVQALIATDVAARGIHVDDLALVVHYDPPEDAETYVHRSGRTGRAGAGGVVLNLVEAAAVRDGRLRRSPAPGDVRIEVTTTAMLRDDLTAGQSAPAEPVPASAGRTAVAATVADGSIGDGTIKFFHAGRGFGFIERAGGEDLFVHHTQLRNRAPQELSGGEAVRFRVGDGPRGPMAVEVELV
jgi:superfamily II DNA/RNA helicase/cold shock CspA family protein